MDIKTKSIKLVNSMFFPKFEGGLGLKKTTLHRFKRPETLRWLPGEPLAASDLTGPGDDLASPWRQTDPKDLVASDPQGLLAGVPLWCPKRASPTVALGTRARRRGMWCSEKRTMFTKMVFTNFKGRMEGPSCGVQKNGVKSVLGIL